MFDMIFQIRGKKAFQRRDEGGGGGGGGLKLQQAKNVEMTPSQYLIQNRVQSLRINNNKLDVGNYKPT